MRVLVLFNASAGAAANRRRQPDDRSAELSELLHEAGIEATLRPMNPESVERDVRAGLNDSIDAIVAAGGDGTISAVAGLLSGTDVPLGVIPLGTLNHFAKDAGIPLQPAEAVRVIAAGRTRAVDVAEVNGRRFVNNSSIGLYPHLVSKRDRQQARLGYGKWVAMLAAVLSIFRRYPVVSVVLETPEQRVPRTTPFVFVGNNRYTADGLMIGRRERLDEHMLSVYFANRTGRFGLLRLAFRVLLGRLQQAADFDSLAAEVVRIHTRKKTLKVAIDGEVIRLTPPLVYRIHPGALRVIVP